VIITGIHPAIITVYKYGQKITKKKLLQAIDLHKTNMCLSIEYNQYMKYWLAGVIFKPNRLASFPLLNSKGEHLPAEKRYLYISNLI